MRRIWWIWSKADIRKARMRFCCPTRCPSVWAWGEELDVSYDLVVLVQGEAEGEQVERVIPMTVCGYYKNPLRGVSDIYEEIYTGEDFIAAYNPGLPKGYDHIYVKLNNYNPLKLGADKEEKAD